MSSTSPADPASSAAATSSRNPGLGSDEAARLLEEHGPNRLAEAPGRSKLAIFVDQFRNLLIAVLIGAAVLAGAVGEIKDAVVITAVLFINAILGYVQESKAEKSLDALRSMLVPTARVRRDGRTTEVEAETLVPGDVVLLEAGDRVPADGHLLSALGMEVDESALTGESTAVAKEAGGTTEGGPIGDRDGAAFMNTVVTRGRAELEVTATGMDTEMGAVADMLRSTESEPTPLQKQLDGLGKRLALVAGIAVAVFLALELLRGEGLSETLLRAVALAVAAIPEGLPAVVAVTLAVGTSQMAKRGAIVKRLASVETLGSTSVICSDKTGTLTMNQMTARVLVVGDRRHDIEGGGYKPEGAISPEPDDDAMAALRVGLLCNDAVVDDEGTLVGDPTEGALVTVARKAGLDPDAEEERWPRVAEIPFDSTRKIMATYHRDGDDVVVHVKGALDVILRRTDLDDDARAAQVEVMDDLADEGLRVLGLARRNLGPIDVEGQGPDELDDHLHDLELVGVVGLLDPPRPEARDAIRLCHRAGVDVKMITGDHARTAAAIAEQLGIEGEVLTGAELDDLDDAQLSERIPGVAVVARVAPEHKVRIVKALKADGEVVAMTGDGVNDAPALKTADIGVAMGITGTEVSKEAAAMVLTDDNFATIVRAVEQGRTIYTNIVTFVRFQLATNIGAILTLLAAPLLGLPAPFTAVQILWVNIIMDGPPAMALGLDPPAPGVMDEPPRRRGAAILTASRLTVLLGTGLVMAIGTLGLLSTGPSDGSDVGVLTLTFTTFVLFQMFNALNARTERASIFRRATLANGKLWSALGAVVVLQVLAVHSGPGQSLFDTEGLSLAQWGVAVAVAASVVVVEEVRKAIVRWRDDGDAPRVDAPPAPAPATQDA